ncbi:MAG TPA: helix-turn-helix domain-containing protein [Ktedonobacteraceae bacterium]|jgi:AcrR family transcriptional regulator
MGIDEQEREQAILDAATQLLLRHGYNKTTMSDVADAVGLHRGLVYLSFPSKDVLVEALIVHEMSTYAQAWSKHLEADPLGGTVASVHRSMLHALKPFPLMAAILTRDEEIFGKYLRKPDNLFTRLPSSLTLEFLQAMQEVGAVRQDVNVAAMAFILDTLTPAILETLASHLEAFRGNSSQSNKPSFGVLMETIAEMLECMLTPAEGANLAAGKAILLHGLDQAQARFTEALDQQKNANT